MATATGAAPSAAERAFEQSLRSFKARLTSKEREKFEITTYDDLRRTIMQIQATQAARSKAMNLTRLSRILEGLNELGKVVTIFSNTSQLVAFVWGPMKFLLQVSSNFVDAFDTLLGAYEQIGEALPLVEQYRQLFAESTHMQEVLVKIYDDILEFHRRALRFFTLPAWQQVFRSIWKDFDTRFQHILQDLRRHKQMVEEQASILHFHQYQQDRQIFFEQLDNLELAEKKRKFSEIRHWLAMTDSLADHEYICKAREDYPNSGMWLLNHPKYATWRSDSVPTYSVLWLNGIPGAGKTVLASRIIQDCKQDSDALTAYFYCKHEDPLRMTCVTILRTLLGQLIDYDNPLVPWLHDQHLTSGQILLSSEILCKELLTLVLKSSMKTYFIIDGLDECEMDQRKLVLNYLNEVMGICDGLNPGHLRIMIVSQDLRDIRQNISIFSEIALQPTDTHADILYFVTKWCKKIQDKFELAEEERGFLIKITCDRVDGMFLFAKLVMTNLFEQVSLKDLKDEIKPNRFPTGIEQAYARIISRIQRRPRGESLLAQTILGWIICARRPLKWHEIQVALSLDVEDLSIDVCMGKPRVHPKEICGSLITELPEDRLELVHYTAKHAIIQSNFVRPRVTEVYMAALCLKYLSAVCFDADISDELRKEFLHEGQYAFQDYAVAHWSDHLYVVIKNGPNIPLSSFSEVEDILRSAVTDFVETYQLSETLKDKEDPSKWCEQFQMYDFCDSIGHAFQQIQEQRAGGSKSLDAINPTSLVSVIFANRAILESMEESAPLDTTTKQLLKSLYGKNWYKCSKVTCYYFHQGFESDNLRKQHLIRHEKPFRCPFENCHSGYNFGFTRQKDLDKHMILYHPESGKAVIAFTRPKTKQSDKQAKSDGTPRATKHPAKYACHLCDKRVTRYKILQDHLKAHTNEKPSKCTICEQAFVRDSDRRRHEESHTGEKKYVCQGPCKYLIPPRTWGCGKRFLRPDGLANHLRTTAAKKCLAPLVEDEKRRKQSESWGGDLEARGWALPVPQVLHEQVPDFESKHWREITGILFGPPEVSTALSSSIHPEQHPVLETITNGSDGKEDSDESSVNV